MSVLMSFSIVSFFKMTINLCRAEHKLDRRSVQPDGSNLIKIIDGEKHGQMGLYIIYPGPLEFLSINPGQKHGQ